MHKIFIALTCIFFSLPVYAQSTCEHIQCSFITSLSEAMDTCNEMFDATILSDRELENYDVCVYETMGRYMGIES